MDFSPSPLDYEDNLTVSCEMTRNVQPDLSIVIGQVNVKNINATWLGSWVIICGAGNLETGDWRVLDREEGHSPHLGQNISTNHLLAVMTVSAINIKNVFFWKANILLSEISRVSYHWWMSPSFVDGNGTISWYCQYFLPDQGKKQIHLHRM